MRDRSSIMVIMNRLSTKQRAQIVGALVEGNSIRATCRMTGASKNTVTKLLSDLGLVCSIYMDRSMRDLPCERIQADEIWSFCYSKQKNVPAGKRGEFGYGDVWTWVALDADTKLVPSYRVGPRDLQEANVFMVDVAKRMRDRIQLTTDGYRMYLSAVENAFGNEVDYAQLIKIYGRTGNDKQASTRYSPGVCIGADSFAVTGSPDPDHVSTSHVERQNLTMRMSMRRFTRLTNAFSKKVENLTAAVSLHFMHYNYVKVHGSLGGKTPAMAAGISDHVWTLPELVGLLEEAENVPTKRGSYKPRKTTAGNSA
jgi:IS1 family transposase